jgi:TusA-related sulfurtransferase
MIESEIPVDHRLDCLGLYCPMPILKTRETMRRIAPGQVLELLSDDPGSEQDVRSWVSRTGNELLLVAKDGAVYRFLVRKAR